VTLPGSEPWKHSDSYLIERQNQKKVVLRWIVWQPSCKLLRISLLSLELCLIGRLNGSSDELILVHGRPACNSE